MDEKNKKGGNQPPFTGFTQGDIARAD